MLTQLNVQELQGRDMHEDGSLEVTDVFYGLGSEGPVAGRPAVVVRLAGCYCQCPECDADYTTGAVRVGLDMLVKYVHNRFVAGANVYRYQTRPLVILTGGEPFRQNISLLVHQLLVNGSKVHIETVGTLYDETLPWASPDLTVCVSPKLPVIDGRLASKVQSLKYVIEANKVDPNDGLPTSSLGQPYRPCRPWPSFSGDVYVQPADQHNEVANKNNLDEAVRSCMTYGYRLSLQCRKLVGIDIKPGSSLE